MNRRRLKKRPWKFINTTFNTEYWDAEQVCYDLVMRRSNGKCEQCGNKAFELFYLIDYEDWKLRLTPENCKALCKNCNRTRSPEPNMWIEKKLKTERKKRKEEE